MRGDTSNAVIHPFFIPATAGLGVRLHPDIRNSPPTAPLWAKYGQSSFECIVEISKGNDAGLQVHAYLYVATVSLHERCFQHARQYLTKACIALNATKLRFIPSAGRPPGFTECVHERLAMLSQVIYFEHYMFFVVDGLEPKMTARIEKEFRHELQVRFPFSFPKT
jgi:hypothetical protein